MIPDSGGDPPPPPKQTPSASEPFRELIEQALSRGRNAKAIWQDLVDDHSFTGGYLVTNRQGQYRLIITSRVAIRNEMFGIMTTLQAGRGAELTPVSCPVAYVPLKPLGDTAFGRGAKGTLATSATAPISSARSTSSSPFSCRRSGWGNEALKPVA